ncbi:unnamed protein product [Closterium sp. Naga37s-1]|nr:unnamed protein product [Closterium sp. Naga37s-1]
MKSACCTSCTCADPSAFWGWKRSFRAFFFHRVTWLRLSGKARSQRKTRAKSATKEMLGEKGKEKAEEKQVENSDEKWKEKAEEKQEEKSVGKGKSAKTGKEKGEEKEKVIPRKGHGILHDKSGDGKGWVGEIKLVGESRYIGKSREKMELAYLHSIAYIVYDGYVSPVLMDELTVLKETELDEWKKVWEEVRILPTGMWTLIWARGVYLPKTRFDDILGKYRVYSGSGDALHDALLPPIWFPIEDYTEEGEAKSVDLMSAMVHRVSMCAAFGKVAASAARKAGDTDENTEMEAQALSSSSSSS